MAETIKTETTESSVTPSTSALLEKYSTDNTQSINDMYDAKEKSTLANLEQSYQQNLSDAEYAKSQIDPAYQKSANSLATQYERNRRNLNTAAAANGLNTGAASQQQLSLNNNYLSDFGSLKESQASELAEADRSIANLKASYQTAVQEAIADNDFNRAQALMDEYNNSFSRMTTLNSLATSEAATRASYGDFSGYASVYGEDVANQMKEYWIVSNPKLAYQTGVIDKTRYNQLTGGGSGGGTTQKTEDVVGDFKAFVDEQRANGVSETVIRNYVSDNYQTFGLTKGQANYALTGNESYLNE